MTVPPSSMAWARARSRVASSSPGRNCRSVDQPLAACDHSPFFMAACAAERTCSVSTETPASCSSDSAFFGAAFFGAAFGAAGLAVAGFLAGSFGAGASGSSWLGSLLAGSSTAGSSIAGSSTGGSSAFCASSRGCTGAATASEVPARAPSIAMTTDAWRAWDEHTNRALSGRTDPFISSRGMSAPKNLQAVACTRTTTESPRCGAIAKATPTRQTPTKQHLRTRLSGGSTHIPNFGDAESSGRGDGEATLAP